MSIVLRLSKFDQDKKKMRIFDIHILNLDDKMSSKILCWLLWHLTPRSLKTCILHPAVCRRLSLLCCLYLDCKEKKKCVSIHVWGTLPAVHTHQATFLGGGQALHPRDRRLMSVFCPYHWIFHLCFCWIWQRRKKNWAVSQEKELCKYV